MKEDTYSRSAYQAYLESYEAAHESAAAVAWSYEAQLSRNELFSLSNHTMNPPTIPTHEN